MNWVILKTPLYYLQWNSPVSSSLWPLNRRSEDAFFTGLASIWSRYIHKFQRGGDLFVTLSIVYFQISNTYLTYLFVFSGNFQFETGLLQFTYTLIALWTQVGKIMDVKFFPWGFSLARTLVWCFIIIIFLRCQVEIKLKYNYNFRRRRRRENSLLCSWHFEVFHKFVYP